MAQPAWRSVLTWGGIACHVAVVVAVAVLYLSYAGPGGWALVRATWPWYLLTLALGFAGGALIAAGRP